VLFVVQLSSLKSPPRALSPTPLSVLYYTFAGGLALLCSRSVRSQDIRSSPGHPAVSGVGGGFRLGGRRSASPLAREREMASPGSKAAISATPARKTFAAATADEEDASVGSAASGGSMLLDLGTSPRRWLLLAIMFANNMHSDWTCFSLAPVADVAEEWYAGLHSDRLLEAFFLANIIAALFEPWIVGRFGLRNGILFGTGLSMIGSFVKGGVPGLATNEQASLVYLGFVLCGIGQPLLQITALEFVSNYFPMEERSLATMLYVNSNQLGVGLAFAMGPLIVGGEASGLVTLNHAMAWLSLLLFGFVWGFLESRPSLPPSKSAATSWANPPPARSILGHLTCATALLRIPNFAMTLIAFALSAGTSNVVSTFLQDIVEEEQQRPNDALAGAIGAAFQVREPGAFHCVVNTLSLS
jgi:MFS family permease